MIMILMQLFSFFFSFGIEFMECIGCGICCVGLTDYVHKTNLVDPEILRDYHTNMDWNFDRQLKVKYKSKNTPVQKKKLKSQIRPLVCPPVSTVHCMILLLTYRVTERDSDKIRKFKDSEKSFYCTKTQPIFFGMFYK